MYPMMTTTVNLMVFILALEIPLVECLRGASNASDAPSILAPAAIFSPGPSLDSDELWTLSSELTESFLPSPFPRLALSVEGGLHSDDGVDRVLWSLLSGSTSTPGGPPQPHFLVLVSSATGVSPPFKLLSHGHLARVVDVGRGAAVGRGGAVEVLPDDVTDAAVAEGEEDDGYEEVADGEPGDVDLDGGVGGEVGLAHVVAVGVEDDGLRDAENDGDDPGDGDHDFGSDGSSAATIKKWIAYGLQNKVEDVF